MRSEGVDGKAETRASTPVSSVWLWWWSLVKWLQQLTGPAATGSTAVIKQLRIAECSVLARPPGHFCLVIVTISTRSAGSRLTITRYLPPESPPRILLVFASTKTNPIRVRTDFDSFSRASRALALYNTAYRLFQSLLARKLCKHRQEQVYPLFLLMQGTHGVLLGFETARGPLNHMFD